MTVTLSVFRVHGINASVDVVDDNDAGSDGEGASSPLAASYTRSFTIEKSSGQMPVRRRKERMFKGVKALLHGLKYLFGSSG